MNESIYHIPLLNLAIAFIPILVVIFFYIRWSLDVKTLIHAILRMITQLLLIGYILVGIFSQKSPWLICLILSIMLFVAGWISIRPITKKTPQVFYQSIMSLMAGCLPVLALVIGGVIRLQPWHEPRYLIPIAGMIFANAMNTISLSTERFLAEKESGASYEEARNRGASAALLPLTNTFFAVGLVSLPGMMTGQILAGISPLIAVRYQIMVMCMIFGSAGLSAIIMMRLQKDLSSKS